MYTSGSELSALLALSKLPFVTVGDITQTIDGAAGTVVNKVQHGQPSCAWACVPHSNLLTATNITSLSAWTSLGCR